MNEWPKSSSERAPVEKFPHFDTILQSFVDGELTLNEVQRLVPENVTVVDNPNSWVSSNRTNPDGSMTITVGLQKLPPETARRWKWGAETDAEQYLVKLSHEYAHVLQGTFDADLLSWLDRGTHPTEDREPYILLYALLNALKGVHGLSKEGVYHAQNQNTGRLDVPTYEDMAETFGSFLLGKEYMLWRLRNSEAQISEENITAIEQLLDATYATWRQVQEEAV